LRLALPVWHELEIAESLRNFPEVQGTAVQCRSFGMSGPAIAEYKKEISYEG
jgi:hypothetical protein